jgi:hypothetical protein
MTALEVGAGFFDAELDASFAGEEALEGAAGVLFGAADELLFSAGDDFSVVTDTLGS